MDFRLIIAGLICGVFLSACGPPPAAQSAFKLPMAECLNEVIPQSFLVRFRNGRVEKIKAESKEQLIDGFITENLNEIEFAEHDFRVRGYQASGFQTQQSVIADNWGQAKINVSTLWQQGYRGDGLAVAVIDTGMDLHHPQLKQSLFTNPGELGVDGQGRDRATNGIDDDQNGFIDDAHGYDFIRRRPLTGDYSYHGTHVAGVIAAAHDDTSAQGRPYVQGVAPMAKILPLAFLNEKGSGAISDAVAAIQYAVQRKVQVINASWGGADCSVSLRAVIQDLDAHGIAFVAAAGNEGLNVDRMPMYPTSFNLPAQINVGSVGSFDYMSSFSNYGQTAVHLFAPGAEIVSTYPGGGMVMLSGTSMAAPFIAGAVALLRQVEPLATVSQIRQALYKSAIIRPEYINASKGRISLGQSATELRMLVHTQQ